MSLLTQLAEDVRSIRERDPAARSTWEVLTCYPGLHAVWGHRISRWLWTHGLKWLGRYNSNVARWLTGIEIHPGAQIGRRLFIDHGYGVVIGETAQIGDDVTIYQGVTLGGTSLEKGAKRHPTLGNGVVVGGGAKVLGGFTVGDGARIGSNAVVVKPVPPGATAVGIPARIISDAESQAAHGFDAYGITRNMPDPVANAIRDLLQRIGEQDQRMAELTTALQRAGLAVPGGDTRPMPLPEFCRDSGR